MSFMSNLFVLGLNCFDIIRLNVAVLPATAAVLARVPDTPAKLFPALLRAPPNWTGVYPLFFHILADSLDSV
jgi:hypothetical protein